MAKQEFLELAQELSGRNLFDVDSVASFLEANFKAINLKNEMVETDEKRQQLLLDKEKHHNEIKSLSRQVEKLTESRDLGNYYQNIQRKIKRHRVQIQTIDSLLSVLKSKRKGLNVEVSDQSNNLILEELKSHIKEQMGDGYLSFIKGVNNKVNQKLNR